MSVDRGYSILLPAGWARIDLRQDLSPQVAALVARSLTRLDDDVAAAGRRALAESLERLVTSARDEGLLDLYFPFTAEAGAPAQVTVGVARLVTEESDPMSVLLSVAATDTTARPVDLDAAVALRTHRRTVSETTAGGLGADDELFVGVESGLRRVRREVRYLVGAPDSTRDWFTIVQNVVVPEVEGADEVAEAFEELFDAVVGSFTWDGDGDDGR